MMNVWIKLRHILGRRIVMFVLSLFAGKRKHWTGQR